MALLDFLGKKNDDDAKIAAVLPNDIYAEGTLDLADTIAPAALRVGAREIELGEKFARSFYTISYPRFLTDSWFTPIINLDKVFDIGIFIHPLETGSALRGFQKKVAEVQSQIVEREEKGLVRDPLLETAYRDLEELRDQLQQATPREHGHEQLRRLPRLYHQRQLFNLEQSLSGARHNRNRRALHQRRGWL